MLARVGVKIALVVALLMTAVAATAYERQLTPNHIREAYFLGKETTFRSEQFFKDYVRTFPVPAKGLHVARIALITPFKAMVDSARLAPDGYNPLKAEEEYKQAPPPLIVEVTVWLTPSFPAHTPYMLPIYGPVAFRDPDFWQAVEVHLVQEGAVEPLTRSGRPLYNCNEDGGCWLTGALIRIVYDPEQVASRPARVVVQAPGGQPVEAEFDLDRLR